MSQISFILSKIKDLEEKIDNAESLEDINLIKSELNKITDLINKLDLDRNDKASLYQARDQSLENLNLRKKYLINKRRKLLVTTESFRVTKTINTYGQENQLAKTIHKVENTLLNMGFLPFLEKAITTREANFEFLEFPDDHPSLDKDQTFFLSDNTLLRTHCTAFQMNTLMQIKASIKNLSVNGNIKAFNIGRVFRRDLDITHYPVFHQLDGICISRTSFSQQDLISFVTDVIKVINPQAQIYNIRATFFPFTDRSLEVDCIFKNQILEILGCGMIKQSILKKADLEDYHGLAFGIGLERALGLEISKTFIYR